MTKNDLYEEFSEFLIKWPENLINLNIQDPAVANVEFWTLCIEAAGDFFENRNMNKSKINSLYTVCSCCENEAKTLLEILKSETPEKRNMNVYFQLHWRRT